MTLKTTLNGAVMELVEVSKPQELPLFAAIPAARKLSHMEVMYRLLKENEYVTPLMFQKACGGMRLASVVCRLRKGEWTNGAAPGHCVDIGDYGPSRGVNYSMYYLVCK